MLAQARKVTGQSPLDFFFQAVEIAVMQGARDYPNDIRYTVDLVWSIFAAGLPTCFCHQLVLHNFSSASKMVEKCHFTGEGPPASCNVPICHEFHEGSQLHNQPWASLLFMQLKSLLSPQGQEHSCLQWV